MRLTFDDQIDGPALRGLRVRARPPASRCFRNTSIVEMKYRVEMPAVLRHLVEEFELAPAGVSKYRLSLDAIVALA